MEYAIGGVLNQFVSFNLGAGDRIWVQKNGLMSYSEGLEWSPRVPGGPLGSVSRWFSGESVFLVHADAKQECRLQVAPAFPSIVYDWDLSLGPVTTLRGNFLAAFGDISIDVGIARNPLAALFGGAGLLLQTVSGRGRVFVSVQGDLIDYDIEAGRSVMVSTGNLAAFASTVDYNIRSVGGCFKMVFGGEGIFMTRMEGPGKVLVQNLKRTPKPPKGIGALANLLDALPT
jgi:uncharacterized protein (TIGR00266 family)